MPCFKMSLHVEKYPTSLFSKISRDKYFKVFFETPSSEPWLHWILALEEMGTLKNQLPTKDEKIILDQPEPSTDILRWILNHELGTQTPYSPFFELIWKGKPCLGLIPKVFDVTMIGEAMYDSHPNCSGIVMPCLCYVDLN